MAGAPTKYTDDIIKEYADKMLLYVDSTDIPIIAEFAYMNDIERRRLYEFEEQNEEFSHAIKKCRAKKEAQLEKLGTQGTINASMAIFSLKQMGWRDKQEIEHSGQIDRFNDMSDKELDAGIANHEQK